MSQFLVHVLRALSRALSPDPDQARTWLGDELSKPAYRESLLERVARWFNDLIRSVGDATRHLGLINPVLAAVLLVLLAVLLAFLLSRLRRNVAVADQGAAVFAQRRLTAVEHRRSAQEALGQGQWDRAVVESVRALAAGLVERGLVPEQADVTVHELTESTAALYPSVAERLRGTGLAFDETRYGDRPADEERARAAVALELDVSSRGPEASTPRASGLGGAAMTQAQTTGAPTRTSSNRRTLLIGLTLLVVLVAVSVLTRNNASLDDPFDPRNPKRSGDQAVARVLAQHGVDVRIARGQDDLLRTTIDAGTAVVVTNPTELGASTLRELRHHARAAGALVLVGDAAVLGNEFDIDVGDQVSGSKQAGCDVDLVQGLVVRTYGDEGLDSPGCFGTPGSSALVRLDDLWLMTSPDSLTNAHVLEADNAALALRLLGQERHLVWYVADATDTPASDGVQFSALLPPWLIPGLWLVFAGVLTLVLWRGRRLGPLVTEPLPVVVRAAESTRSRGQIYRSTGDRQHAAAVLVEASRRRLTELVRLPRGAPLDTLVGAVAARTGRDPWTVYEMLSVPLIAKDSQLVELGRRLTQLENEVRAP